MTEKTYSMIKPDAYEHKDEIISLIKKGGFNIVNEKDMELSTDLASEFYAEHKGKPFYEPLIEFITSGNIHAMIIEKENAVKAFRDFIGATDPNKAEEGTIRKIYGTIISRNAIHGADSVESANREIKLIFGD